MVLDRAAWRGARARRRASTLRVLDADDPALAAARAVQNVGFGAAGHRGRAREGIAERDAALDDRTTDFLRERMRRAADA